MRPQTAAIMNDGEWGESWLLDLSGDEASDSDKDEDSDSDSVENGNEDEDVDEDGHQSQASR